jgi:hypothetical protein
MMKGDRSEKNVVNTPLQLRSNRVVLDKQLDAFADRYEPVPELTPDEKAEREAEKAEAEFSGIGDVSMRVIFSYT